MGIPSDEEWPECEADKWYCCTTDEYGIEDPDLGGCSGAYIGKFKCCRIGWMITQDLAIWKDCQGQFCHNPLPTRQRLISIVGPFDTQDLCRVECP